MGSKQENHIDRISYPTDAPLGEIEFVVTYYTEWNEPEDPGGRGVSVGIDHLEPVEDEVKMYESASGREYFVHGQYAGRMVLVSEVEDYIGNRLVEKHNS